LQPRLSSFRQRDAFLLRYSRQYTQYDAIRHLVASIEEGLRVTAPATPPHAELFEITQRLDYAFAAQSIQSPEEQQVKLALRRRQHHSIELRTRNGQRLMSEVRDWFVACEYGRVRIAPKVLFIDCRAREKQSRELRQLFLPNRNLT
jgi:hypothetical protein